MKYSGIILTLISALILILFSSSASPSLLISPTYGYLDGRERTSEVILVNSGSQPETYRLRWTDKKQLVNGNYENQEPGIFEYSAADYLRFSPRQVSLQPGERQVIKLVRRNTSNLPEGDYRSHLNFMVVPSNDEAGTSSQPGLNLKMTAIINYSIPVVVKVGGGSADVSIGATSIVTEGRGKNAQANVELLKKSKYGVFGRIEVWSVDNDGSPNKRIGMLNGSNIFRESEAINFQVALDLEGLTPQSKYLVKYIDVLSRQEKAKKIIN